MEPKKFAVIDQSFPYIVVYGIGVSPEAAIHAARSGCGDDKAFKVVPISDSAYDLIERHGGDSQYLDISPEMVDIIAEYK
jgi:hypothetical protein